MSPVTACGSGAHIRNTLRLPIDAVHFELDDTIMPQAPVHGGSITLASVGNAVVAACRTLRDKLRKMDATGRAPYTKLPHRNHLEKTDADASPAPGDAAKI